MKSKTTQQEILLITGTRFSSRLYCPKDETSEKDQLSDIEKLEEACWNGMIQEMLPELCEEPGNKKLFLWNIIEADAFLELKLGTAPVKQEEMHLSIDPYSFLHFQLLS